MGGVGGGRAGEVPDGPLVHDVRRARLPRVLKMQREDRGSTWHAGVAEAEERRRLDGVFSRMCARESLCHGGAMVGRGHGEGSKEGCLHSFFAVMQASLGRVSLAGTERVSISHVAAAEEAEGAEEKERDAGASTS